MVRTKHPSSSSNQGPASKKPKVHFEVDLPQTQDVLMENSLLDSDSEVEETTATPQLQITKNSFLDHVTNLWVDGRTLKILLPILSQMLLTLTLESQYELKRRIQVIHGCMKKGLKGLCLDINNPERLKKLSVERFLEYLSKDASYTILFEDPIPEEVTKSIYQMHNAELQASTSASSSHMVPTTSTSYTTVATPLTDVDVPVSAKPSGTALSDEEELFGDVISVPSMSKISFRMAKKTHDKLITWSAEESSGFEVVKLDIMPFRKCAITDKKDWWRAATRRIQYVTSSSADPVYHHLHEILKIMNRRMMSIEDKKREEKDLASKFG